MDIYNKDSKRKPEVSRYIAEGYSTGKYGFLRSSRQSLKWLRISASEGNTEDQYRLCYMAYAIPITGDERTQIITLLKKLVANEKIQKKFGVAPCILLARFLAEQGREGENPKFFEEAMGHLLMSLAHYEETAGHRKAIVWQTQGGKVGNFGDIESSYLEKIERGKSAVFVSKSCYELAFHHLWGGYEDSSLSKAMFFFLRSTVPSDPSNYFFVIAINQFLSTRTIHRPSLVGDISKDDPHSSYCRLTELLRKTPNLNSDDRAIVQSLISSLSRTRDFHEAVLTLAFCFQGGLYGLSNSAEHEVYWLKKAADGGNPFAKSILKNRYPLTEPLTHENKKTLSSLRTHDKDGRPNVTIIGAGLSGVMTAVMLSKLAKAGKLSIGDIYLLEQNDEILTGASIFPCRLHLGWEYSKENGITGKQCLLGAVLFRQMFQTERVLTTRKINDFLLAKQSLATTQGDNFLSEETLMAHSKILDGVYKECIDQLVKTGKYDETTAANLLFGPAPLFEKITEEELRSLGLSDHFATGIHTAERGLQPVGWGIVLEDLLNRHKNIHVVTGYSVTGIGLLPQGGFRVEGRDDQPRFDARYLINAAWDNNSKLKRMLGVSSPPSPGNIKLAYLRSIALIDISGSQVPDDRSFFGLVGSHGGMVSVFNKQLASIFIPKTDLSYQGEYTLREDENLTYSLPPEAGEKQGILEEKEGQIAVAQRILDNAKSKYPWLEGAKPLGLITRTTISGNNDICQRPHINAQWLTDINGCLQLYATKATFAPLVALEAIQQFLLAVKPNFSEEEKAFLAGLENIANGKSAEGIFLPDCFRLISDDTFMDDAEFQGKMQDYAQRRNLPLTVFDANDEESAAEPDLSLQSKVELEPLEEEINDDEEDTSGRETLEKIASLPNLETLVLRGWNLSFSSRFTPLSNIIHQLQDLRLEQVTLTIQGVRALFEKQTELKRLSITRCNPTKKALKEMLERIPSLKNLEGLDLSGNNMQGTLGYDTNICLSDMIAGSSGLKQIFLRGNGFFKHVRDTPDSLPLELAISPILVAITRHPHLEKADLSGNEPVSSSLQDYLDHYFLSKAPHL